jgi:hypothetical protein
MSKILIITDDELTPKEMRGKPFDELHLNNNVWIEPSTSKVGQACSFAKQEVALTPCVILVRHPQFRVLKGRNDDTTYEMTDILEIITNEQDM